MASFYRIVLCSLGLICSIFQLQANHILGGNISYECLGNDEYSITLSIYEDCFGGTPAINDALMFFTPDAACGLNTVPSLATLQSTVEVSDLCEAELPNSSCNPGGFTPGVYVTTYQTTVTLDPSCVWTANWAEYDYNYFINADFPVFDDAYVSTTIDPSLGCNQTISITGDHPIPYALVGQPLSYQIEYDNPNGNTVNFTLINPQVESNQVISPLPGYDNTGITLSPGGLLEFTPPSAGNFVVGILVEEVDGMGNILYTMYETMAIVSILEVPGEPEFTGGDAIVLEGGSVVANNSYEVCVGDSICLTFEALHPDPLSVMTITSNITDFMPMAEVDSVACPVVVPEDNAICTEVCFLGDAVQDFTFEMFVIDSDCENPATDEISIDIQVTSGAEITLLSSDLTACEGDEVEFEITAEGEGALTFDYSVQSETDLEPDTISVVLDGTPIAFNPTETTEYCIVSLEDSEGCLASLEAVDTCFTATINPLITTTGFGNDTTICEGQSVNIDLNLTGTAPYTVYYTETSAENGIVPNQSVALADGEVWTITPATTIALDIDSIQDSGPDAPCVIYTPDSYGITVNDFTEVTLACDSILCQGSEVIVDFFFQEFIGTSFDITFTIQENGQPAITETINGLDIMPYIAVDSIYSYSLNGILVNGLQANTTFQITDIVDDGTTCVTIPNTTSTTLLAPTPTFDLSVLNNEACVGEAINADVSLTGVGPWTIEIDTPDSGVNDQIITNEANFTYSCDEPGVYNPVNIIDSLGCPGTVTGTIDYIELALPTLELTGPDFLCTDQTVEIDLNLTGAPVYDIVLQDPNGDQINIQSGVAIGDSVFTANLAGDYSIISVTDQNCVNDDISTIFSLGEESSPSITVTSQGYSCSNDSTFIELTLDTGTAPFTYDLENVSTTDITNQSALTAEDSVYVFNAGDYNLINILDDNDCPALMDVSFSLTDEPLPEANAGPDNSECANAEATLGTPDANGYDYEWTSNSPNILENSTDAQPTVSLINTGMADYIFEGYLDVYNGFCHEYDTVAITITPQPLANAGADIDVCYGEPAMLNGDGDGTISWENNGNLDDYTIATPNVLSTLETDTFILVIEDLVNIGCFGLDTVIVNVNPEITVTLDYPRDLCYQTCDGEITYSASGGTDPLTLTWTDGANTEITDLTNLCADDYNLNVVDGNLCELDSLITINELPEYFIDDVLITDPICFEDETGVVTINAVDVETYILDSETSGGDTFTNLVEGDYSVSVIDSTGCEADTLITLTSNPEFLLDANFQTQFICIGDEITFEATATGGVGDFTYNWISDLAEFNTTNNSVNITPQANATVEVYVTDDAGQCFSDTLTMEIQFPPAILSNATEDLTICEGETVDLESLPTGGNGILSCTWNIPETGTINSCTTSVTPAATTIYTVTVEDGCSVPAVQDVTVTVNPTPVPDLAMSELSGCFPLTVDFSNLSDPALSENCLWDFGDGSDPAPICSDISYTYAEPGVYFPSLTITSADDCSASLISPAPVTVYDYPVADFEWTPDPVTILEPEVQFINLSEGASNFTWDADGAFTSTEANPYFEFEPNTLDAFNICLAAESQFGCADTLCQLLIIEGVVLVHVPSSFTPDGDGLNEVFMPVVNGISADNYMFRVFSRGGDLLFESSEPGAAWDGSYAGGDFYNKDDVYVWTLSVQDTKSAEIITYRGHVTMLR